jgi:hypothetical protein
LDEHIEHLRPILVPYVRHACITLRSAHFAPIELLFLAML